MTNEVTRGATLRRLIVAGMFAGSMLGLAGPVPASAAVACPPPPLPPPGAAAKNIDTTLGCNDPSGNATNPATGWITVTWPAGVNQANVFDWFTAFPGGAPYVGSYASTFACQPGTATPGNYFFNGSAPSGTPSHLTAAGLATSCQYAVTFIGTPPAGVTTLQNNLQVVFASGLTVMATSAVVLAVAPPVVPEVPLAIALPIVGGVIAAVFLGWSRRRGRPLAVGVK